MADSLIQPRFDGGEISQRLSGRFDSELIKKSLKESSNFEPLAQGSLRMRSGSLYSNTLAGDMRERLVQIRTSKGSDYIAELLDYKMRIYSISGTEEEFPGGGGGTPAPVSQQELIENGSFGSDSGAGWSSKFFNGGSASVLFIAPEIIDPVTHNPLQLHFAEINNPVDGSNAVMFQKITVPAEAYCEIAFKASITDAKEMQVKISTQAPSAWAGPDAGGDMMKVILDSVVPSIDGGTINGPNFGERPDFTDPNTYTAVDLADFANPNGVIGGLHLVPGDYYLSFQITQHNGASLWIDDVSVIATYVSGGGGGGTPGGFDIPTPWSANEVAAVQFDTETGRDRTIFTHGKHDPWALTFNGAGAWVFGNVNFTNKPPEWANGNFPACIQIHGGRAYYGGEPLKRSRVVASKSNDLDNLTVGSNPDDAMDFNVATKGSILWLKSAKMLNVGTDLGLHVIFGSTGFPRPGDIQVSDEGGYPSAPIQAARSGNHVLFITSNLRRVRAAQFNFQSDSWEAKDLLFAAEHLSKGRIKEVHHAWTPDGVTILLLKDGTLVFITFEPIEQVLACWKANIGAAVVSCAVAEGPTGAYLWMAVSRNGAMRLERLTLSEEDDDTLRYVDSHIVTEPVATVFANGDPGVIIEGLEHLAGLQVKIVLNGFTVTSNVFPTGRDDTGLVKLTDMQTGGQSIAGQTVTVGVSYLARGVTMNRNTKTGKAHSSKIGIILNDSALPKINGKRPPESVPSTPMGTEQPRITGKKTAANLGWSDGDSITIEQDQPFRTEICGIYSITEVTD